MDVKAKFEDRGSERAVIAAVLQNPDLIVEVQAKISERDFLSDHHRCIYSILHSLYDQGVHSFDMMAVLDYADKRNVIESIGGGDYIDALYRMEVDPRNLPVYMDLVQDSSVKYRLYKEASSIQSDILQNVGNPGEGLTSAEVLARAESRIIDISMNMKGVEEAIDMKTGLRDRLAELASAPVDVRGLSSGIPLLDKAINGFAPGSLSVFAARAKAGKSTLLMNLAGHMAYKLGIPVLYVDTEMSTREQQTRLLSHVAHVPERAIVNGKFINDNSFCQRIERGCQLIENGLFLHKYYPGYTIDGLKSLVRKYAAREGIGAFFFDYIKIPEVNGDNAFKEHQILGNVATALKDLAGTLNIPVITAAQIKRSESGNPKTHYNDNDVADSDRIGRYCSNLFALAQKSSKEMQEDGPSCGTHRLQVLLARAGGSMYKGIDLDCHFPTLTMRQSEMQANGPGDFGGMDV
jgi:replicative DNA helicase